MIHTTDSLKNDKNKTEITFNKFATTTASTRQIRSVGGGALVGLALGVVVGDSPVLLVHRLPPALQPRHTGAVVFPKVLVEDVVVKEHVTSLVLVALGFAVTGVVLAAEEAVENETLLLAEPGVGDATGSLPTLAGCLAGCERTYCRSGVGPKGGARVSTRVHARVAPNNDLCLKKRKREGFRGLQWICS